MSNKSAEGFNSMSKEELKYLIDAELKKDEPNYELVGKLTKIISGDKTSEVKEQELGKKQLVITKKSSDIKTESTPKKPGFFKRAMQKLSRTELRKFILITTLGAFYIGVWYFRILEGAEGNIQELSKQNIALRVLFGNFGLITVTSYLVYYILRRNFSVSKNNDEKISARALSLLFITTILDAVFLVFDIAKDVKFINIYLVAFLLTVSTTLKSYAYTLFFRTKDEDNYFLRNHLGFYARLTDFQFIVYVFGGIATMILGISAGLVAFYDISPWTFLFGFLLPFCVVCAGSIFSLSYFDFNKKVYEEF